ncbi:FAD-dependent oxidoreductase [Flagellimonas myxillae]|uniref:FAD-dependent oxidoreductase n=1 Tax=Flagellimonas myxillae TaxID=2942214 RepID=UPI00201E7CA0|nr:FAD-dependent oxidoreductase [Muricauda myxillae]MCL6264993.1 FAD-dependent oxidoreductase [Muricauda myxillae]
MKKVVGLLVFSLVCVSAMGQQEVDIVIVGGGAGGTSAGIQASRMGAKVQIIEKTSWLGGMLTSAGVSAIDGNHKMPSGIWGEFREKLYGHYGGPKAVATGWVSHTLFEPSVGKDILTEMATHPNLDIVYGASYNKLERQNGRWIVHYKVNGKPYTTFATVLIDATETGELLPLVGADFRLGMDSKQDTGEKEAPESSNTIVQDLTYVAILKDVGDQRSRKGLVKKPKNYDPEAYVCACKREGGEMFGSVADCDQMLTYGKLPNQKYMINWPNCGNDFFVNWAELSTTAREDALKQAKAFTQGFVYYIQNELGYKNLRLADEFPTRDNFPMIPYHREGRRAVGKTFLVVDHLERPYDFKLYKTGVAIGDYPIDHHHDKNPDTPAIEFINIKVPSYSIPMGSLVPEGVDNFLVSDKNISVSNIVNGTTRLQPVVLGIGQAAGTIAATAIKEQKNTSEVSIRQVQKALVESKAYIMPYIDVTPDDKAFGAIQRIGASGVLKGFGVPYKWANETWFYPERMVSEFELKHGLLPLYPELKNEHASGQGVTPAFLAAILAKVDKEITLDKLGQLWKSEALEPPFSSAVQLNRRTLSILIDRLLDPFGVPVDFNGNFN